MGSVINWIAYVWLITSETLDELLYTTIGDPVRRFISGVELGEQAPRIERRTVVNRKAANTV